MVCRSGWCSSPADTERYQTRYAARPGAVAALEQRGIHLARITLHVGLGTFRPVDTEDLTELELHSEWIEVSPEAVEAVNACRGRVIAVGTTSVRALEGAAQAGDGALQPFSGPVNLVIKPGYRFRVVEGLLTNFYLPKSSLLLLVSALIGRPTLLELYADAVDREYRFFPMAMRCGFRLRPILRVLRQVPERHLVWPSELEELLAQRVTSSSFREVSLCACMDECG